MEKVLGNLVDITHVFYPFTQHRSDYRVYVVSGISPGKCWEDTLTEIMAAYLQIHTSPFLTSIDPIQRPQSISRLISTKQLSITGMSLFNTVTFTDGLKNKQSINTCFDSSEHCKQQHEDIHVDAYK
jgi:Ni,Fe-hydrogenase I cytochrome b subunit